jgi:hypothetical protein
VKNADDCERERLLRGSRCKWDFVAHLVQLSDARARKAAQEAGDERR